MNDKDLRRHLEGLFSGQENSQPEQGQAETQKPGARGKAKPPAGVSSTEVERLQQALQESQVRLQILIDDLPVGYHEIDTRGRIRRVNRTALKMLGHTAEEVLGRPAWEFCLEGETARRATLDKLAKQLPLQTIECTYVRKDGTHVPMMIQDQYLLDANGQIEGIRTTLQDLTERKQIEEDLLKFKRGIEQSIDAVFITDTEGHIVYTNPAFEKVYGYSRQEALGKTPRILKSGLISQDTYSQFWKSLLSKRTISGEIINKTKDGRLITIEGTNDPIVNDSGQIIGFLAIHRDATERKQVAATLAQRALQMSTAAQVSRAAASVLDLDELLPKVVELVRQQFAFYYVGLFLLDDAGQYAVLRAATGEAGCEQLKAGHKLKVGGSSMIGWCVANGQARIALDVGTEAVRFENPLLPKTRSEIALPLISRGHVIGAATIQSDQAAAFTEEDITILQTMTDQIANAIENARLFTDSQRRITELSILNEIGRKFSSALNLEELVEAVYREVGRVFDVSNFYIATYEAGSAEWFVAFYTEFGERQPTVWRKLGVGLTTHILLNRQTLLFGKSDEIDAFLNTHPIEKVGPQAKSWMGVPLIAANQVVGAMAIQDYERENLYGDQDLALFTTIAAQAAIAIQNTRLFETTRRRAEELAALNELSRALTAHLSVEEVLDEAYRQISRVTDTTDFFIALYDPEKNQVTFPIESLDGKLTKPYETLSADNGLTGYLIRTRQPLLIQENSPEQEAKLGVQLVAFRPGRSSRCWVGAPLIVGDHVLGAMAVMSYTDPHAFNEHDRDLLTAIASQVSIVLQNARLFEEARVRAEELAVLNEMSRTLSAMLDTDAVIRNIYDSTSRLMDTTNLYVALYDEQTDEVSFPFYAEGERIRALSGKRRTGKGLTEYVIRTRKPLLIEENISGRLQELGIESIGQDAQSWLGVPMSVSDQVIGVIAVQSYATPRLYNEHHRDLLHAIASQAAVVLQNARLFEETRKTLDEAKSLYEASRNLEAASDLQEMVVAITDGLHVPGLHWATLFMFERDACGEVQFVQVQDRWQSNEDIAPMPIGTRFSKDMFASAGLVLSARPVFFDDTQNNERIDAAMADVLQRRNIRTLAVLPIGSGKTQWGILMLAGKGPHPFTLHEMQSLPTLVGQMAVIIENRRLLQETQARAHREQILREITARVRSSTDPDTIVRTAVRELGTALGRPAFVQLGSAEQLAQAQEGNGEGRHVALEGGE